LSELVARHFRRQHWQAKPKFSDAYGIYMRENPSAHRLKFKAMALQAYPLFVTQFGDIPLDELRHIYITEFKDSQLASGLHAKRYYSRPDRVLGQCWSDCNRQPSVAH